MKRIWFILLVSLIIITGCEPPGKLPVAPPATATLTWTPLPPPLTSTPRPPTPTPQVIEIKEGGFTVTVQTPLEFNVDENSINLSDKNAEIIISLNGRPYIASAYTLESFLNLYINEMESRGGGTFELGAPYEISMDGILGLAIDLTGTFLDAPIAGKAIALSPGKDFIFFGLGLASLQNNKFMWERSGHPVFDALLESVRFKDVKK